jgi:hypothetical protein
MRSPAATLPYLFYCGSKSSPTSKLPIDPIQFLTQTQETTALIDNPLSFSGISFQKRGPRKLSEQQHAKQSFLPPLCFSTLLWCVVLCRLPIEVSSQERTPQSETRGIIWLVPLLPFRLVCQTVSTHPCHADATSYKPGPYNHGPPQACNLSLYNHRPLSLIVGP